MFNGSVPTMVYGQEAGQDMTMWSRIVYYWYVAAVPLSIIFNAVIVSTLIRVRGLLPRTTRLIMTHQSILDTCSSLLSFFNLLGYDNVQYPVNGWGLWLCMNLNMMYWAVDATAQFNSNLVTFERYFAVCWPLRRILTVRRICVVLAGMHIAGWSLQVYGLYQTYIVAPDGYCTFVDTDANELDRRLQGVLVVALVDLSPLLSLAALYPPMIAALTRKAAPGAQESAVKSAASKRLTRTLLVASAVSVAANLPDAIIYGWMHAILQVFSFGYNSWQIIVIGFFKSLYPLCNPVIYSFSTQRFRYAIRQAFSCPSSS